MGIKRAAEAGNEQAGALAVPVGRQDHIQGALNAPLTLVEYGDFQCPYCGQAYGMVKELQRLAGRELRFIFRNFPLTRIHEYAEHAAETAEAAGRRGKFWDMHDKLFENQESLDDTSLAQYAAELRLDAEDLLTEVQQERYAARLREQYESGVRSGVEGTPTFFLNGAPYEGDYDAETFLQVLRLTASKPQAARNPAKSKRG